MLKEKMNICHTKIIQFLFSSFDLQMSFLRKYMLQAMKKK